MSAPTDPEAMGAESGRPRDAMTAVAASAAASAAGAGGADSSSSSTTTVAAAAEPQTYAARLQSLEEPLLLQSADGHAPAPLDSADSSSSSLAVLAPAAPSSSPSLSNSSPASLSSSFWLVFFLLALVLMLAESSRGVVIPTLALYQQSLGGSTAFLSALVALFSVGRLLSSYAFARFLSNSQKRARASAHPSYSSNQSLLSGLLFSLLIVLLGHLLYIGAAAGGLSMLLLARLLVGFGTGTLVLARTFVGDSVPPARKPRFMAWLGVVQFVGFAFTPGLGSISVNAHVGTLHINSFNFGSYLLAALSALAAIALGAVMYGWAAKEKQFQQRIQRLHADQEPLHQSASISVPVAAATGADAVAGSDSGRGAASPAAAAPASSDSPARGGVLPLWLLVFGNLVVRGSLSIAETFGSLLYFLIISPNESDQVADSGRFFLALGVGGVFVFLSVESVVRRLGARWSLCLSLGLALIGYGCLMDFDHDLSQPGFVIGMIFVWAVSSPIAQTIIASQLSAEVAERQQWAAAAAAAAAQNGNGGGRVGAGGPSQAVWMGRLTAGGSIGRILFPLIGGAVYRPGNSGEVMLICFLAHLLLIAAYAHLHRHTLGRDVRRQFAALLAALGQHELAARCRGHADGHGGGAQLPQRDGTPSLELQEQRRHAQRSDGYEPAPHAQHEEEQPQPQWHA